MKSAAIVTLYGENNIGNKLQNYAVQELLKDYFEEVTTLTYNEPGAKGKSRSALSWKGKIISIIGFPRKLANEKRALDKRKRKFVEFSNTYLNIQAPKDLEEYGEEDANMFDAFCVGSDQVWHGWWNLDAEFRYFFLEFVPQEKRFCISPSFGFEAIPKEYEERYIKGLTGFLRLSCREKSGCELIKKHLGKEAILLLDPTMMISVEKWNEIATRPTYQFPEKFILVYILGDRTEKMNHEINSISKSMNMPIVDVMNMDYVEYFTTSPSEFIYLISRTEYVCTNSFHGCVFSILYNKQFKLFTREDFEGAKMLNRQKTLCEKFGINTSEKNIDYQNVNEVLAIEQEKFKAYLDELYLKETK